MKNKIYIWTFLFLATLIYQGCSPDLGNYDYKELNGFQISGLSNKVAYLGDTVRMSPKVAEDRTDSTRFAYKWTLEYTREQITTLKADSIAEIVGTNKSLVYVVKRLSPGGYKLKFTVTDKNTGIEEFALADIQVRTAFERGYMLLEETPKGGDIALVNDSLVYRNVFSRSNGDQFIPLPMAGIYSANAMLNNFNNKIIFVSANNFNKELDQLTFRVVRDLNDIFVVPNTTVRAPRAFEAMRDRTIVSAIVWDSGKISQVETGSTNVMEATYDLPIVEDYELAPYLGSGLGQMFVGFDQRNHRFLGFDFGWDMTMSMIPFFGISTSVFDVNNIPQKMVYGSNIFNDDYFAGIFRDEQGHSYVYELQYKRDENTYAVTVEPYLTYPVNLTKVSQIDNAQLFTASRNLPFLYYAVDKTIYLFDIHNQQARAIYTFPAGENITTLEWANKEGTNQLVSSTYDGKEGRFYVFNVSNAGSVQLPARNIHRGFGKIIQTHIKYNSASQN